MIIFNLEFNFDVLKDVKFLHHYLIRFSYILDFCNTKCENQIYLLI